MAGIKEILKGKIPEDILNEINRSFEIVGDIAIVDIMKTATKYEKEIADSLMKVNSNIKVVLKKEGVHGGEFRTQKLIHIGGENRKDTIYKENGIQLKLNPETVYFSAKLGTERKELCSDIKEGSDILVMFSGCGPYTFNILKLQPNINSITSVELNPEGHKYALLNLDLNRNLLKKSIVFKNKISALKEKGEYIKEKDIIDKLNKEKIHFYNGDVKKVVREELTNKNYDYIFMPLPKDAEMFLDEAFLVAKKGCIVHMYDFLHENEFPNLSEDKVKDAAKINNREVEIIETRKVGQYSPRKYRVCCDFIIR